MDSDQKKTFGELANRSSLDESIRKLEVEIAKQISKASIRDLLKPKKWRTILLDKLRYWTIFLRLMPVVKNLH